MQPEAASVDELVSVLRRLVPDAPELSPTSSAAAVARHFFAELSGTDLLGPDIPREIREMERSILEYVASRFGAKDLTAFAGVTADGGSESVFCAVRAAQLRSAARRGHAAQTGEVLVPTSAHPAYAKACSILGLKLQQVEIDARSGAVDPKEFSSCMSSNTVLVGLSAPSTAFGILDPIEEISHACLKREIWLHVDACAGWALPWLSCVGVSLPRHGFELAGLTSLSTDLHKFGPMPSGCAPLIVRKTQLVDEFFMASAAWNGYCYVSSSVPSTRVASGIGAAWAGLMRLGGRGLEQMARSLAEVLRVFMADDALGARLRVIGKPSGLVLGILPDDEIDPVALTVQLNSQGVAVAPVWSYKNMPTTLALDLRGMGSAEAVEAAKTIRGAARRAQSSAEHCLPVDRRILREVLLDAASARGFAPKDAGDPTTGPSASVERRLSTGRAMAELSAEERAGLLLEYGKRNAELGQ